MRPQNLLKCVFAGAFLIAGNSAIALAQAPTGGGGAGHTMQTPSANAQDPLNTSANDQSSSGKVDDKKFVKDAAVGGMTEVELGKLALQKSSNSDVKQFAQRMIDDHTKANEQLKALASQENLQLPSTLDSKHQSRVDKLSKLSGDQFDKAYAKDQLKDHENDVREFNAEAKSGTDPNIKTFASGTLPTLQEHLEMVKNLTKVEKKASE